MEGRENEIGLARVGWKEEATVGEEDDRGRLVEGRPRAHLGRGAVGEEEGRGGGRRGWGWGRGGRRQLRLGLGIQR